MDCGIFRFDSFSGDADLCSFSAGSVMCQISQLFEYGSWAEAQRELIGLGEGVANNSEYDIHYGELYHVLEAFYLIGLRGEDVIELGGRLDTRLIFEVIKPCSWTSITLDLYESDYRYDPNNLIRDEAIISVSEKYTYTNLGLQILYLANKSTGGCRKYSRVVSVAAFEHLRQPGLCIAQLCNLCHENCLIYAYFTPTWSSSVGHHWCYGSIAYPPYFHLLNDRVSSFYQLINRYEVSMLEAERDCHFIYSSTRINRLLPKEWLWLFRNTALATTSINAISLQKIKDLNIREDEKEIIAKNLQDDYVCEGYRIVGKLNHQMSCI